MKPRFYTRPEKARSIVIRPEYVMVNIKERRRLFLFGGWKHAILDVGIEIFSTQTDYPAGYHEKYIQTAKYLTRIFEDRIWCVIPDYCDDLSPGLIKHNVEKTLANIRRYHKIPGVNWVWPLQARFLDLESFRYCCSQVKALNPQPARLAIGTVCKTQRVEFIKRCCLLARRYFPGAWIHAFGLTLKALPHVKALIDSFDSLAWTWPRERGKGRPCTAEERLEYYQAYTKRIREILEPGYTEILNPSRL